MNERDMKERDSAGKSDAEIELLRRRTGLQLDQKQVDALNKDIANVDAIARRMRQGLQRDDEPAFVFKVPR